MFLIFSRNKVMNSWCKNADNDQQKEKIPIFHIWAFRVFL